MNRRPWYSLKVKFAVLVTVLLGASFLGLSLVLVDQATRSSKKDIETSAKAFAELSTPTLGNYFSLYYQSGYTRYVSLSRDIYELQPVITRVRVISVDEGKVLADSQTDSDSSMAPPLIDQKADEEVEGLVSQGKTAYLADGGSPFATRVIVPYEDDFGARPFSLEFYVSYAQAEAAASQSRWLILAAVLGAAVVSIIAINWVVGRAILGPIDKLIAYAEEVARGNLEARFTLKTGDELESLAQAVDFMSHNLGKSILELKELDESKNEFIMIASHNLRTPLTSLKGYLPLLSDSDGKTDKKTQDGAYRAVQGALSQLNHLVEQLIDIVQLRQETEVVMEAVSLRQAVGEALSGLQSAVAAKGVTVELGLGVEAKVQADKDLLVRALSHILDNAIKFSPDGGIIEIKSKDEGERTELTVVDQGPGMTAEQIDNLFQMFHRQTSILDYNYEGVGLGLYITRLILTKFKGWLTIMPGKGARVVVTLVKAV